MGDKDGDTPSDTVVDSSDEDDYDSDESAHGYHVNILPTLLCPCSFQARSNNALRKHRDTCSVVAQPSTEPKESDQQVIRSTAKYLDSVAPGQAFRGWHYAKFLVFIGNSQKTVGICGDSGASVTMVDRDFLS